MNIELKEREEAINKLLNDRLSDQMEEKEETIESLVEVIERYREKIEVCEEKMREYIQTLADCDKALNAKNIAVVELQKSVYDLQMVNDKLKQHNDEKDKEILLIKESIKEAELKRQQAKNEEQLQLMYLGHKEELTKELEDTIKILRTSLETSNTECQRVI